MRIDPQYDTHTNERYYVAEATCPTTGRKVICEGANRHDAATYVALIINTNRLLSPAAPTAQES